MRMEIVGIPRIRGVRRFVKFAETGARLHGIVQSPEFWESAKTAAGRAANCPNPVILARARRWAWGWRNSHRSGFGPMEKVTIVTVWTERDGGRWAYGSVQSGSSSTSESAWIKATGQLGLIADYLGRDALGHLLRSGKRLPLEWRQVTSFLSPRLGSLAIPPPRYCLR